MRILIGATSTEAGIHRTEILVKKDRKTSQDWTATSSGTRLIPIGQKD